MGGEKRKMEKIKVRIYSSNVLIGNVRRCVIGVP